MKCSKCNAEFDGKFCSECGNPAEISPDFEQNTAQTPSVQVSDAQPIQNDFTAQQVLNSKKKKPFYKRWWFVVIIIIVALGILGKIIGGNSDSTEEYEEFKWSSFALHEKLPEPKSKEGKYLFDYSDSLEITVCNTTKSDYIEYIDKCETEFGYIIDKEKTSDSFSAKNSDNYEVSIDYYEYCKEMEISLSIVEDEDEVEDDIVTSSTEYSESTVKTQDNSQPIKTEQSDDSQANNSIRKEFKEAMDSYEKFMEEYIEFMEKYNKNPGDLSLLTDYTKWLSKYTDMCNKFAEWENEDLNLAETSYYIDVQARVSKKILEVAY